MSSCQFKNFDTALPDIYIFVYDTVRADHCGCYGYPYPTTLTLDTLAQRGQTYANAISSASWTLPAHASILTGLYPSKHGARFVSPGQGVSMANHSIGKLHPNIVTLPNLLKLKGYHSICIGGAPALDPAMNLTREFDYVDCFGCNRSAEDFNRSALRYMDNQIDSTVPVFMLFNYFDAHGPYVTQERYGGLWLNEENRRKTVSFYDKMPDGRMKTVHIAAGDLQLSEEELEIAKKIYDSEIAYLDHHAGKFLYELQKRQRLKSSLVFMTSDHGELFGEENLVDHARSLNDSLTKVPLIYFDSTRAKSDRNRILIKSVGTIDIFATILHRVGLLKEFKLPSSSQPLDDSPLDQHFVGSELYRDQEWIKNTSPRFDKDERSFFLDPNTKLTWQQPGNHHYHNLAADPSEKTPLPLSNEMEDKLNQWIETHPTCKPKQNELDHKIRDELSAMGYLIHVN